MRVSKIIVMVILITTTGFSQNFEYSPFGMFQDHETPTFDSNLLDLGVRIVRFYGTVASWDQIERTQGTLDWRLPDRLVGDTYANGITVMLTVTSFNRWDQGVPRPDPRSFKFPKNIDAYLAFLRTMVERYDGDGDRDAAGSPVVDYFQIENEIDGGFWNDTPERYAELLIQAYNTIKQVNPNAKVVMAGASDPGGLGYFEQVFAELKNKDETKQYFEAFDLHWYGLAQEYRSKSGYTIARFIDAVRDDLAQQGWDRSTPVWVTETATYSGTNVVDRRGNPLPAQDERRHAANLVKRYVHYLTSGAQVVMWFKLLESHHAGGVGAANDFMENTGLINNPLNDGKDFKKLAYYTYKFMIDRLEGSDWDRIRTIRDSANVRIYAFPKLETGEPVYVAWWDWFDDPGYVEGDSVTVDLVLSGVDSVRITRAVPDAESGADLHASDYPAFFTSETRAVINGNITLVLGQRPVYLEADPVPTSVENVPGTSEVPGTFALLQNYPNPFNPSTTIRYRLPRASEVELAIFSISGQRVRLLVRQAQPAGEQQIAWNGRDDHGDPVASGVYWVQFRAGEFMQAKKVLLMK